MHARRFAATEVGGDRERRGRNCRRQAFGSALARSLAPAIAACLIILPAGRAVDATQIPSYEVNELTFVLAGNALFSRGAQEGIMLAVPWKQLAEEFFPRRDVRVGVEYWRGERGKVDQMVLTDDARSRPFDPKRANYLLAGAKLTSGYPRVVLLCEIDVCHVMKWLLPFLNNAGLAFVEPRPAKDLFDTKAEEPAVLWVRRR